MPQEYTGVYRERRRESGWQLYEAVGIQRGDQAASARQTLKNNDCSLATLLRDLLVEFGPGLRRTIIRVRMDNRLRPIDFVCDWHVTRGANRLQEARADLRPADQEEWSYRVERRPTELAHNEALPRPARE